ncbi:WbqC family protein [Variovorax sp. UC122_21]|uniref:WbqC family protein n=1 Tax=Variovorax sp. UC122_21 TaxID=3374554 RepID=UPI003756AD8F
MPRSSRPASTSAFPRASRYLPTCRPTMRKRAKTAFSPSARPATQTPTSTPSAAWSSISRERFAREGIVLQFIRSLPVEYRQFGKAPFVPWLSMVDVMMFNPADEIRDSLLTKFELV